MVKLVNHISNSVSEAWRGKGVGKLACPQLRNINSKKSFSILFICEDSEELITDILQQSLTLVKQC